MHLLISRQVFFWAICWIIKFNEPAPTRHSKVNKDFQHYLPMSGYLNLKEPQLKLILDKNSTKISHQVLPMFGYIPETAVLNKKTTTITANVLLATPDKSRLHDTRVRRYTAQGSKWKKSDLTWKLLNQNNDNLSRSQVEDTLQQAFARWEAVTNLRFHKLEKNSNEYADIDVSFVYRFQQQQRDPTLFYGAGNVLAHGYYPNNNKGISGDLHFYDETQFTLGTTKGINLLWVAVHEIGHCIGLEHSSVENSIMYPRYKGYMGENFTLSKDDILGIQSIYGSKTQTRTMKPIITTTKVSKSNLTNTCSMKGAVFEELSGITYVFNGDKIYKIDQWLKNVDGPILVTLFLPNVKSVDSAYINRKSEVIFFEGTSYYIYSSLSKLVLLESGSIFKKFRGLRNDTKHIDAAFRWPVNRKTYLFSGDLCYKFSDSNFPHRGYPQEISKSWKNAPTQVDSVLVWKNKKTYFFKGSKYYRINDRGEVENYYPKSISGSWMQC
ncbi:matrix metalloproteinase-2-like isoform X2 [Hydra vulgaris]|uniref:Matrix metalloproteinase-2-like isoform X2 n=1 Tax=Hydra vulgaris TaxID=6087 RepID=A0ABM4CSQ3_HYDVU